MSSLNAEDVETELCTSIRNTRVHAGVALMYMNLAERLGDPAYLKRALPLVETQLKGLRERRFSFLCGDAGPLAVGAVLYHLLGREEDSQKLVRK